MTQLNTIAFIYTWKGRKLCTKVVSRLNQIDNELKFVFFEDDGHIPVFMVPFRNALLIISMSNASA